jgi:hypothetical protein
LSEIINHKKAILVATKGVIAMEQKNKLDQVSLGNVTQEELQQIKDLEQKLGDKYYLIAFNKKS